MCPLLTPLPRLKVPKLAMSVFVAFVKDGSSTSVVLAQRWLGIAERVPTQQDHELIMRILNEGIRRGLITGRAGISQARVKMYVDLALTDKGEAYLDRTNHRLWFVGAAYQEIKDFAARILAYVLKP